MAVQLFLSCVSNEFGLYREPLRTALALPDVAVHIQEDFKPQGGDTLSLLLDYLKPSAAIVHFLGEMTGRPAPPICVENLLRRHPDLRTKLPPLAEALDAGVAISYTQWEAWLALYLEKAMLIVKPAAGAPRDPRCEASAESRAAQAAHEARLKAVGRYAGAPFANADILALQVVQSSVIPALKKAAFEARVAPPNVDISRIDAYAPAELIGRETETALVDDAWTKAAAGEPHPRVLAFVALGGEGKTALAANWAIGQSAKEWRGCEAAFAWSFYSQGSTEQQAGSSDIFLAEALKFFGAPVVEGVEGPHDKGRRLARWIGDKRALLILDGLEPLQYPPSSPLAGQLKDAGVSALLKGLAQRNEGLCLVTTRYAVRDLEGYKGTAPQIKLEGLSKEAGADLLTRLGVNGTQAEREKLSEDVRGHALTLNLIGAYLAEAYGGDIRKRDRITLKAADAEKGGHAFAVMDSYVRWFESEGETGLRALTMLRLMGLFDRPADAGCLKALWEPPAIEGLTEPIVTLDEAQRNIVLKRLENAKLMTVNRDAGGALASIDAHPLLREYFATDLQQNRAPAWKAAHGRVYEHLRAATPDIPTPTFDDLAPLYQAVMHGCKAGLHQQACDDVFCARIRGEGHQNKRFGAFGEELTALSAFFDVPWRQITPDLAESDQALILHEAGFALRAVGRPAEAQEPMRRSLEMRVARENWIEADRASNNLSELELSLGHIATAMQFGQVSVEYAERAGSPFPWNNLGTYGNALHQSGNRAGAWAVFRHAEATQSKQFGQPPLLYSLRGSHYCDFLLGTAEIAAWRRLLGQVAGPRAGRGAGKREAAKAERPTDICESVSDRATQTLGWAALGNLSPLTRGHDYLTLARSALYLAILRGRRPQGAHVDDALTFLRAAGQRDYLCRALLTRALFRATTNDFRGAREDLDEAYEIAERGPMQLHLADIHLHRARLFGLMASRPKDCPAEWGSARADLDRARTLIEECGYGRRREELADAEAANRRMAAKG